jgi:polyphosphate kinase 2 (PPK2 family)
MLSNTSTDHAPWHVVPSNRKWFRNLLVSEVLRSTLDDLKLDWPKPDEDLSAIELK